MAMQQHLPNAASVSRSKLVRVSPECQQGQLVLTRVCMSFLDKNYTSYWRVSEINLIQNAALRGAFFERKSQMQRSYGCPIEDSLLFLCLKDNNLTNHIVENGPECRPNSSFNIIGDSSKGIYLCCHADIQLRVAEGFAQDECKLIIYKTCSGKKVKQRPMVKHAGIAPTPGADCHICSEEASLSDGLHIQVVKSQVYLYELMNGQPLKRPRQCLPLAVITFKKSAQLQRIINQEAMMSLHQQANLLRQNQNNPMQTSQSLHQRGTGQIQQRDPLPNYGSTQGGSVQSANSSLSRQLNSTYLQQSLVAPIQQSTTQQPYIDISPITSSSRGYIDISPAPNLNQSNQSLPYQFQTSSISTNQHPAVYQCGCPSYGQYGTQHLDNCPNKRLGSSESLLRNQPYVQHRRTVTSGNLSSGGSSSGGLNSWQPEYVNLPETSFPMTSPQMEITPSLLRSTSSGGNLTIRPTTTSCITNVSYPAQTIRSTVSEPVRSPDVTSILRQPILGQPLQVQQNTTFLTGRSQDGTNLSAKSQQQQESESHVLESSLFSKEFLSSIKSEKAGGYSDEVNNPTSTTISTPVPSPAVSNLVRPIETRQTEIRPAAINVPVYNPVTQAVNRPILNIPTITATQLSQAKHNAQSLSDRMRRVVRSGLNETLPTATTTDTVVTIQSHPTNVLPLHSNTAVTSSQKSPKSSLLNNVISRLTACAGAKSPSATSGSSLVSTSVVTNDSPPLPLSSSFNTRTGLSTPPLSQNPPPVNNDMLMQLLQPPVHDSAQGTNQESETQPQSQNLPPVNNNMLTQLLGQPVQNSAQETNLESTPDNSANIFSSQDNTAPLLSTMLGAETNQPLAQESQKEGDHQIEPANIQDELAACSKVPDSRTATGAKVSIVKRGLKVPDLSRPCVESNSDDDTLPDIESPIPTSTYSEKESQKEKSPKSTTRGPSPMIVSQTYSHDVVSDIGLGSELSIPDSVAPDFRNSGPIMHGSSSPMQHSDRFLGQDSTVNSRSDMLESAPSSIREKDSEIQMTEQNSFSHDTSSTANIDRCQIRDESGTTEMLISDQNLPTLSRESDVDNIDSHGLGSEMESLNGGSGALFNILSDGTIQVVIEELIDSDDSDGSVPPPSPGIGHLINNIPSKKKSHSKKKKSKKKDRHFLPTIEESQNAMELHVDQTDSAPETLLQRNSNVAKQSPEIKPKKNKKKYFGMSKKKKKKKKEVSPLHIKIPKPPKLVKPKPLVLKPKIKTKRPDEATMLICSAIEAFDVGKVNWEESGTRDKAQNDTADIPDEVLAIANMYSNQKRRTRSASGPTKGGDKKGEILRTQKEAAISIENKEKPESEAATPTLPSVGSELDTAEKTDSSSEKIDVETLSTENSLSDTNKEMDNFSCSNVSSKGNTSDASKEATPDKENCDSFVKCFQDIIDKPGGFIPYRESPIPGLGDTLLSTGLMFDDDEDDDNDNEDDGNMFDALSSLEPSISKEMATESSMEHENKQNEEKAADIERGGFSPVLERNSPEMNKSLHDIIGDITAKLDEEDAGSSTETNLTEEKIKPITKKSRQRSGSPKGKKGKSRVQSKQSPVKYTENQEKVPKTISLRSSTKLNDSLTESDATEDEIGTRLQNRRSSSERQTSPGRATRSRTKILQDEELDKEKDRMSVELDTEDLRSGSETGKSDSETPKKPSPRKKLTKTKPLSVCIKKLKDEEINRIAGRNISPVRDMVAKYKELSSSEEEDDLIDQEEVESELISASVPTPLEETLSLIRDPRIRKKLTEQLSTNIQVSALSQKEENKSNVHTQEAILVKPKPKLRGPKSARYRRIRQDSSSDTGISGDDGDEKKKKKIQPKPRIPLPPLPLAPAGQNKLPGVHKLGAFRIPKRVSRPDDSDGQVGISPTTEGVPAFRSPTQSVSSIGIASPIDREQRGPSGRIDTPRFTNHPNQGQSFSGLQSKQPKYGPVPDSRQVSSDNVAREPVCDVMQNKESEDVLDTIQSPDNPYEDELDPNKSELETQIDMSDMGDLMDLRSQLINNLAECGSETSSIHTNDTADDGESSQGQADDQDTDTREVVLQKEFNVNKVKEAKPIDMGSKSSHKDFFTDSQAFKEMMDRKKDRSQSVRGLNEMIPTEWTSQIAKLSKEKEESPAFSDQQMDVVKNIIEGLSGGTSSQAPAQGEFGEYWNENNARDIQRKESDDRSNSTVERRISTDRKRSEDRSMESDRDRDRETDRRKDWNRERGNNREPDRRKDQEWSRDREIGRDGRKQYGSKEREWSRDRDKERDRETNRDGTHKEAVKAQEWSREKATSRDKGQSRDSERHKDRETNKEWSKDSERERDYRKERESDRNRERDRHQEPERNRTRPGERDSDRSKEWDRERHSNRDSDRDRNREHRSRHDENRPSSTSWGFYRRREIQDEEQGWQSSSRSSFGQEDDFDRSRAERKLDEEQSRPVDRENDYRRTKSKENVQEDQNTKVWTPDSIGDKLREIKEQSSQMTTQQEFDRVPSPFQNANVSSEQAKHWSPRDSLPRRNDSPRDMKSRERSQNRSPRCEEADGAPYLRHEESDRRETENKPRRGGYTSQDRHGRSYDRTDKLQPRYGKDDRRGPFDRGPRSSGEHDIHRTRDSNSPRQGNTGRDGHFQRGTKDRDFRTGRLVSPDRQSVDSDSSHSSHRQRRFDSPREPDMHSPPYGSPRQAAGISPRATTTTPQPQEPVERKQDVDMRIQRRESFESTHSRENLEHGLPLQQSHRPQKTFPVPQAPQLGQKLKVIGNQTNQIFKTDSQLSQDLKNFQSKLAKIHKALDIERDKWRKIQALMAQDGQEFYLQEMEICESRLSIIQLDKEMTETCVRKVREKIRCEANHLLPEDVCLFEEKGKFVSNEGYPLVLVQPLPKVIHDELIVLRIDIDATRNELKRTSSMDALKCHGLRANLKFLHEQRKDKLLQYCGCPKGSQQVYIDDFINQLSYYRSLELDLQKPEHTGRREYVQKRIAALEFHLEFVRKLQECKSDIETLNKSLAGLVNPHPTKPSLTSSTADPVKLPAGQHKPYTAPTAAVKPTIHSATPPNPSTLPKAVPVSKVIPLAKTNLEHDQVQVKKVDTIKKAEVVPKVDIRPTIQEAPTVGNKVEITKPQRRQSTENKILSFETVPQRRQSNENKIPPIETSIDLTEDTDFIDIDSDTDSPLVIEIDSGKEETPDAKVEVPLKEGQKGVKPTDKVSSDSEKMHKKDSMEEKKDKIQDSSNKETKVSHTRPNIEKNTENRRASLEGLKEKKHDSNKKGTDRRSSIESKRDKKHEHSKRPIESKKDEIGSVTKDTLERRPSIESKKDSKKVRRKDSTEGTKDKKQDSNKKDTTGNNKEMGTSTKKTLLVKKKPTVQEFNMFEEIGDDETVPAKVKRQESVNKDRKRLSSEGQHESDKETGKEKKSKDVSTKSVSISDSVSSKSVSSDQKLKQHSAKPIKLNDGEKKKHFAHKDKKQSKGSSSEKEDGEITKEAGKTSKSESVLYQPLDAKKTLAVKERVGAKEKQESKKDTKTEKDKTQHKEAKILQHKRSQSLDASSFKDEVETVVERKDIPKKDTKSKESSAHKVDEDKRGATKHTLESELKVIPIKSQSNEQDKHQRKDSTEKRRLVVKKRSIDGAPECQTETKKLKTDHKLSAKKMSETSDADKKLQIQPYAEKIDQKEIEGKISKTTEERIKKKNNALDKFSSTPKLSTDKSRIPQGKGEQKLTKTDKGKKLDSIPRVNEKSALKKDPTSCAKNASEIITSEKTASKGQEEKEKVEDGKQTEYDTSQITASPQNIKHTDKKDYSKEESSQPKKVNIYKPPTMRIPRLSDKKIQSNEQNSETRQLLRKDSPNVEEEEVTKEKKVDDKKGTDSERLKKTSSERDKSRGSDRERKRPYHGDKSRSLLDNERQKKDRSKDKNSSDRGRIKSKYDKDGRRARDECKSRVEREGYKYSSESERSKYNSSTERYSSSTERERKRPRVDKEGKSVNESHSKSGDTSTTEKKDKKLTLDDVHEKGTKDNVTPAGKATDSMSTDKEGKSVDTLSSKSTDSPTAEKKDKKLAPYDVHEKGTKDKVTPAGKVIDSTTTLRAVEGLDKQANATSTGEQNTRLSPAMTIDILPDEGNRDNVSSVEKINERTTAATPKTPMLSSEETKCNLIEPVVEKPAEIVEETVILAAKEPIHHNDTLSGSDEPMEFVVIDSLDKSGEGNALETSNKSPDKQASKESSEAKGKEERAETSTKASESDVKAGGDMPNDDERDFKFKKHSPKEFRNKSPNKRRFERRRGQRGARRGFDNYDYNEQYAGCDDYQYDNRPPPDLMDLPDGDNRDPPFDRREEEFFDRREEFTNRREEEFMNRRGEGFMNNREEEFMNHREEEFMNSREEEFMNHRGGEFLDQGPRHHDRMDREFDHIDHRQNFRENFEGFNRDGFQDERQYRESVGRQGCWNNKRTNRELEMFNQQWSEARQRNFEQQQLNMQGNRQQGRNCGNNQQGWNQGNSQGCNQGNNQQGWNHGDHQGNNQQGRDRGNQQQGWNGGGNQQGWDRGNNLQHCNEDMGQQHW